MERNDREMIERALMSNFELRKLYEQHARFEHRLQKLGRQVYLTPTEQVEEKRLKKMKLAGVERMLSMAAPGSLSQERE